MATDKIAKNLERFAQAIAAHDRENPTHTAWGIGMNGFDIERLGWEEGDIICGLTVVGDKHVPTGMMKVTCDAEPKPDGEEVEEVEEVVDAVADRELVTTGPSSTPGPSWN